MLDVTNLPVDIGNGQLADLGELFEPLGNLVSRSLEGSFVHLLDGLLLQHPRHKVINLLSHPHGLSLRFVYLPCEVLNLSL